ncbi:hypothetical protein B0H14DRAFT_3886269 [Mycena olivaceomarginata]|nr:hypothetical protein B0H14DRAFT_3886269 [Mycena olivaceomarginata]
MGSTLKKVRTFTNPNAARSFDGSLTGSAFINDDLFVTLIRTSTNVSLTVVRSTEIWVDGSRKPSVNIDSIKNPKANIKLTGQILRLKAVPSSPEDLGSYLMGKSTMKGSQIATDAPQLLSVAGHLIEPVSPTAVSARNRLTPEEMKEIKSAGTTWAFNELFLRTLIVQLWKRVDGTQMGLREIPLLKATHIGFPYCYSSGTPALISEDGTKFITEKSASANLIRGRSNLADCAITLKPKGDTFELQTKCRYTVTFQYQTVNKGSTTTPSRNVPSGVITCPSIC